MAVVLLTLLCYILVYEIKTNVWLFLYFPYRNGKGKGDIYCCDAYVS